MRLRYTCLALLFTLATVPLVLAQNPPASPPQGAAPVGAQADIRKGEELGLGRNPQFETAVRVGAAHLLIQSSAFDEALAQLQLLTEYPDDPPAAEEAMGLCALASPDDIARITPQRRAVVDLAGKAAWALAGQHHDMAAAEYRQLLAQYPKEPGGHYGYGLGR